MAMDLLRIAKVHELKLGAKLMNIASKLHGICVLYVITLGLKQRSSSNGSSGRPSQHKEKFSRAAETFKFLPLPLPSGAENL